MNLSLAVQTQKDEENEEELSRIVDFINENQDAKHHVNFEKLRKHPDILMRMKKASEAKFGRNER